jgi:hypothetical protein
MQRHEKEHLESISKFVKEQLSTKWVILITHDKANNVVSFHYSEPLSVPFVESLEGMMFQGIVSTIGNVVIDVTDEPDA